MQIQWSTVPLNVATHAGHALLLPGLLCNLFVPTMLTSPCTLLTTSLNRLCASLTMHVIPDMRPGLCTQRTICCRESTALHGASRTVNKSSMLQAHHKPGSRCNAASSEPSAVTTATVEWTECRRAVAHNKWPATTSSLSETAVKEHSKRRATCLFTSLFMPWAGHDIPGYCTAFIRKMLWCCGHDECAARCPL
jgi:hypothetical protein